MGLQARKLPRQGIFSVNLRDASIIHRSRRVDDAFDEIARGNVFVRLVGSSGRTSRRMVKYSVGGYGRRANGRSNANVGSFKAVGVCERVRNVRWGEWMMTGRGEGDVRLRDDEVAVVVGAARASVRVGWEREKWGREERTWGFG